MSDYLHMLEARDLLEEVYKMAHNQIEINPSNYNHDDVCRLNDEALEIYERLESGIASLNDKFNDPVKSNPSAYMA